MSKGAHTFWLPRRGNSPAEYEDAFAADEAAGRYAVADGATESCFAGLWARLLVEEFAHQAAGDVAQWPASVPALQQRWDADVRGRTLPWYAEPGVERGASATFLGIVLTATREASSQWQAVAVGDTCLLHTRGAALLRAFPLEHSQQFNNFPRLVGSRMSVEDICGRQHLWADGQGRPADRLWMLTDALAQCCLAEHEAGGNPWAELESLLAAPDAGERFTAWIEGLRDTGRLHNDDVTLLAIPL